MHFRVYGSVHSRAVLCLVAIQDTGMQVVAMLAMLIICNFLGDLIFFFLNLNIYIFFSTV